MRRRRVTLLAPVALGALLLAGLTVPTGAEAATLPLAPNASPSSEGGLASLAKDPVWAKQQPLLKFKSWILNVPGIADSGYVESMDDVDTGSTTLLWHGSSPLQTKVIAEGKTRGISVSIRPWGYTRGDMDASISSLWKQVHSDPTWNGFKVADIVGLDPEHPGISIEGAFPASAVQARSVESAAAKEASLTTVAQKATAIPVRVVSGVEVANAAGVTTTRNTDVAPFLAGGYMFSPSSGTSCSTGFTIYYGTGMLASYRTTTARHCPYNDYVARDQHANSYGTHTARGSTGQADVLAQHGVGGTFVGGPGSNQAYHVKELIDLNLNSWVCTGGGNTGVHCNIKVTQMAVSYDDGYGAAYNIRGDQRTSGGIATMQGDSGGPVFGLVSGQDEVQATGMIQAMTGTIYPTGSSSCGAARDPGNKCSTGVLFTSERTILNDLGAQLDTQ